MCINFTSGRNADTLQFVSVSNPFSHLSMHVERPHFLMVVWLARLVPALEVQGSYVGASPVVDIRVGDQVNPHQSWKIRLEPPPPPPPPPPPLKLLGWLIGLTHQPLLRYTTDWLTHTQTPSTKSLLVYLQCGHL